MRIEAMTRGGEEPPTIEAMGRVLRRAPLPPTVGAVWCVSRGRIAPVVDISLAERRAPGPRYRFEVLFEGALVAEGEGATGAEAHAVALESMRATLRTSVARSLAHPAPVLRRALLRMATRSER